MEYEFTIPGRLDGLNDYTAANRTNPYRGGSMKQKNEKNIIYQIRRQLPGIGTITAPVLIYYRFYEKDEIIKENAEAIEKYFGYIKTRLNADGLIEIGLGDWCQTYTSAEGDYETPVEITDSLTIIDMVEKTAEMFGVIGKNI